MTALLRSAPECQVLRRLGSALLVVKDTGLGFGRLVLFSGYRSGSAWMGRMESGDHPCPLPARLAPAAHPGSGSAPVAADGRKGIKGFSFKYIENKRGK